MRTAPSTWPWPTWPSGTCRSWTSPTTPSCGEYTKEPTVRWSAEVDAADAFVFVMPEYNHGFNAPLKNAIDFLRQDWAHEPHGSCLGGVAAGIGGPQLKQI